MALAQDKPVAIKSLVLTISNSLDLPNGTVALSLSPNELAVINLLKPLRLCLLHVAKHLNAVVIPVNLVISLARDDFKIAEWFDKAAPGAIEDSLFYVFMDLFLRQFVIPTLFPPPSF